MNNARGQWIVKDEELLHKSVLSTAGTVTLAMHQIVILGAQVLGAIDWPIWLIFMPYWIFTAFGITRAVASFVRDMRRGVSAIKELGR